MALFGVLVLINEGNFSNSTGILPQLNVFKMFYNFPLPSLPPAALLLSYLLFLGLKKSETKKPQRYGVSFPFPPLTCQEHSS